MTAKTDLVVQTTGKGVVTSLMAFVIWGGFPLYFKQLYAYDSVEVIAHRIIWTFLLLLVIILLSKRLYWVKQFKDEPKWLAMTCIGGVIIAINWLTYIWAVQHDQLLEASLGYFICPLVGVGLSLIFLQERLRKLQWVALLTATLAVLTQIAWLGSLPWVSLVLALSFSVYGIIQRKTPLMAVDALFIETAVLVPFVLYWLSQVQVTSSDWHFWFSHDIWLLSLAGPITLIPLLLYNKSTKMVAFSVLSFMNYLTPSFIFLLAVLYYHEPFDHKRLLVFGLIWFGLLLFSMDLWQHRPNKRIKATV